MEIAGFQGYFRDGFFCVEQHLLRVADADPGQIFGIRLPELGVE